MVLTSHCALEAGTKGVEHEPSEESQSVVVADRVFRGEVGGTL